MRARVFCSGGRVSLVRLVDKIGLITVHAMSLEERFNVAADKIKAIPADKMSNEDKLKLYSLFKQATIGDCNTKRPGLLDLAGKAKWDAWKALEDPKMSTEDAMTKYIEEVGRHLPEI